jgi:2-haloacid dehalogenase
MTFAANLGSKPAWLTFDCYGTLIQWDEGLVEAVGIILSGQQTVVSADSLIEVYDRYEHQLETEHPHRAFRDVAGKALALAMHDLDLSSAASDVDILTSRISAMPPFPEVIAALSQLKRMGFRICVISNTDDDIIAGNIAQLGGHIDLVVTAQQARAYKPSAKIFEFAHQKLGVSRQEIIHICASPHLDLMAARDIGFRAVWVDRGTARRPLGDYTPDAIVSRLDRVPVLFKQLGW